MTPAVVRQLAHELEVIERTGLAEFFLICWDLMRFAKSRGIPAQGRGSAADSIVAYVLGITRVDPIRHNLLFERFINEGRTTYPDVDIDFSSERREEVIQYVYGRYGPEHTGMVCNVVTYRARSVVREVGVALGFPRPLVDRVAKALETYDSVMVRRDLEADGGFAEFFRRPSRERDADRGRRGTRPRRGGGMPERGRGPGRRRAGPGTDRSSARVDPELARPRPHRPDGPAQPRPRRTDPDRRRGRARRRPAATGRGRAPDGRVGAWAGVDAGCGGVPGRRPGTACRYSGHGRRTWQRRTHRDIDPISTSARETSGSGRRRRTSSRLRESDIRCGDGAAAGLGGLVEPRNPGR